MRLPAPIVIFLSRHSKWFLLNSVLGVAIAILAVMLGIKYLMPKHQVAAGTPAEIIKKIYTDVPMINLDGGVPVVASDAALPSITATAALAFDLTDKTILFNKNGTAVLYPASTTKMVTALVARELYNLEDSITITSEDLLWDNVIGLQVGETLTVNDLLQALLIKSANETAYVLALHSPNGYVDFIKRMNDKVVELGLEAHFTNPAGFDDPGQKASAYDLAIIAEKLLADEVLAQIVATQEVTIASTQSGQLHRLVNTNQLLHQQLQSAQQPLPYRVFGVKTGTTDLANEALVTGIDYMGHRILIVVLGAKNRYNDTQQIIDYVIRNVTWQSLSDGSGTN